MYPNSNKRHETLSKFQVQDLHRSLEHAFVTLQRSNFFGFNRRSVGLHEVATVGSKVKNWNIGFVRAIVFHHGLLGP